MSDESGSDLKNPARREGIGAGGNDKCRNKSATGGS